MHALILTCAALLGQTVNDQAAADREVFPQADWGYIYYLSTAHLEGETKGACEASLAFVVASTSRQPIIEKCVPVQVSDGLYRIRLDELQWDWRLWHKVLKHYPYTRAPGAIPLVVRADWLIAQLTDTTQSKAYYLLLYGRDDLNRNDFLKVWGANNEASSHFGIITKSKAVSVSGIRLIENRPTNLRTSAWGTRDMAKITDVTDPLEHLDNNFKHEAEEWLVGMPKQSLRTGQRGSLLAAWLNDAKGKRQEEAPVSIVTDRVGFRGQPAIRNWGSCIGCHAQGINDPGVSELRRYIVAGEDIFASPKKYQEQIELFHLSDAGKQLARDNEDFAQALKMCNGLSGEDNSRAFSIVMKTYDEDITLTVAAAEHYTTSEELKLALAYASDGRGARLAGLAHDLTISRTAWEDGNWYRAYLALQLWRSKK